MKTSIAGVLVATVIGMISLACGSAREPGDTRITINGTLNTPCISTQGGTVYLQITLKTPDGGMPVRRPMNLSIVLDRSGSMGDERKIEYAKRAIDQLIDQLGSEDILSIVIYDNEVEVLREAQRVGTNKYAIERLVERIYPRGSTNLGGGMVEGLREVEQHVEKEYVNRVILLSDGLANEGIVDPSQLNRIARRYRSKCISLTTMGVGLDYNENLMAGLAESGGGNYYFIENPHSIASILNNEFNMLSTMVAQKASLVLTLGERVVVKDVIGCEYQAHGNQYTISVGDLYSQERREFTVELGIPSGTGAFTVASGAMEFERDHQRVDVPGFRCDAKYTEDLAQVDKERNVETQARADIAVSTRNVDQAMKALDQGKPEEAQHYLREARSIVNSSPAAGSAGAGGQALQRQANKLSGFEGLLKDSATDSRKAKKSIQYENYKTQKGKEE